MRKPNLAEYSGVNDAEGRPIPYNAPIVYCWWCGFDRKHNMFLKAKIRKRKSGDIFEFFENSLGNPCLYRHRLTALKWSESDLTLIENEE